jgi:hypothetical protein
MHESVSFTLRIICLLFNELLCRVLVRLYAVLKYLPIVYETVKDILLFGFLEFGALDSPAVLLHVAAAAYGFHIGN